MQHPKNQNSDASPRLVIAAEAEEGDFDKVTLENWKAEGFEVTYLPFSKIHTQGECEEALQELADSLDGRKKYAIIAFGKAASAILETAARHENFLCALVAYYPEVFSKLNYEDEFGLDDLIHFADTPPASLSCRHYRYPEVQKGFAEAHLAAYDKVAAGIAWSRTLATLRKAFKIEVDLEKIWEDHLALEFGARDVDATMATMVAEPYVNHIPTLTGGIGYKDLHRFYKDFFIPGNPPSLKMTLLSRTVGTDRVVDELHTTFKHTQVMPWILPDVEPTNRDVEVTLVAVICIRGGKLYHEHIYWDQATVLVQTGLIDPKVVPGQTGKGRLPVVDRAGARKVVDESAVKSNELISTW